MDRVKDYRVRILCSDPTQDMKKRLTFLVKKRPKLLKIANKGLKVKDTSRFLGTKGGVFPFYGQGGLPEERRHPAGGRKPPAGALLIFSVMFQF